MANAIRRARARPKRLGVALLGLVLGFVLLELGVRAYAAIDPEFSSFVRGLQGLAGEESFTHYVAHPFLPYVMRPNAELTISRPELGPSAQILVRTNSDGFRAHELPTAGKENDEVRIFCLGESTTFGANAATNETTWPELLEAKLASAFPTRRIRVFNLGMSMATSAYSVALLGTLVAQLDPDLVIVYHGINEYDAAGMADFRHDHAHYFRDFDPAHVWLGVLRSLPNWARWSAVVVVAGELVDQVLGVKAMRFHMRHEGGKGEVSRGIGSTLETLRTMRSISHGAGAEILFSTFQFYDGRGPAAVFYNDSVRAFLEANRFLYVDQDALIPDYDRSINVDECHFTPKGEGMMATNFFDYIVARGLITQ